MQHAGRQAARQAAGGPLARLSARGRHLEAVLGAEGRQVALELELQALGALQRRRLLAPDAWEGALLLALVRRHLAWGCCKDWKSRDGRAGGDGKWQNDGQCGVRCWEHAIVSSDQSNYFSITKVPASPSCEQARLSRAAVAPCFRALLSPATPISTNAPSNCTLVTRARQEAIQLPVVRFLLACCLS
jgi:hypothetical protein